MRKRFCAYALAVAVLAFIMPHFARADEEAEANSTNYFFSKYINVNAGTTSYWNPANALAATYSSEAQAWNEGGTAGPFISNANAKFLNVGGAPSQKFWPSYGAQVPAPGTTKAVGDTFGQAYPEAGRVWGTNYIASAYAVGKVDQTTIPAGGFGRGWGKAKDPWVIDLPYTDHANDLIEMHTFIELGSSHVSIDSQGSGELGWHLSMDGVSEFQSYLFDYSLSMDASTFSSSLLVAPGVRMFLNDESNSLEFDTLTEVTAGQLKSYLDSFHDGAGWDSDGTPVTIGLLYEIPNNAVGVGGDLDMRHFLLHNDVYAQAEAVAPVPEPAMLSMMGFALFGLVRRRP